MTQYTSVVGGMSSGTSADCSSNTSPLIQRNTNYRAKLGPLQDGLAISLYPQHNLRNCWSEWAS